MLVVRSGAAEEEVADFEEVVERARTYVAWGKSPSRAAARVAREFGWRRGEVYDRLVRP